MKTSNNGIQLIKKFEGVRLVAYKAVPSEKYYTIGYGHYGSDVTSGMTISESQAEVFLRADLIKFENKVNKYMPQYNFTQNEYDAMVSFCYNVGSIDQLTANGTRTMQQIANKIREYNKAGGKVLNGLVKRRQEEYELFCKDGALKKMTIQTFSLKAEGNKPLSENFKVKEFRCKDGSDKILIDVDFVRSYLQDIRSHFGAPVTINSAFRTPTYNAKVGGASASYHLKGQAFDIVVKGHDPEEVARYAQSIGVKGVIQYDTFTHVDSRGVAYYAKNNNGNVTKVSKF